MRPLREILLEEYWTVALRRRVPGGELPLGTSNAKPFTLFKPPKDYWLADPFLFEEAGETWLFFEQFDNQLGRGAIACSRLRGAELSPLQIVLAEPHHLSYPCVFRRGNGIYLLPECAQTGAVTLYRCVEFPLRWEPCQILLDNARMVDSTHFIDDDGKEWLFTAQLTDEQFRTRLCLYAIDANGQWIPHPQNPLAEGMDVRPAGGIVNLDRRHFRPAQISEHGQYGTGLVFQAIDALTEDAYAESEARRVMPSDIPLDNRSKAPIGLHTYALSAEYEAVDLKFQRVNVRRMGWILRGRMKNARCAQHFPNDF